MMVSEFSKTVLPNGVRLLTEFVPGVSSVSVGVWAVVGARDETNLNSGISHFIEHMIFKGTKSRDALEIAKTLDIMGGFSNAFTSRELTCFHAKVLDEGLDRAIELLADILLNSLFDSQETDRERGVILQEISMVEDSPDDFIHEIFNSMYWGDTSLGRSILGSLETVSQIDSSILRDFMNASYSANRLVIAAAGNVQHDQFINKVSGFFQDIVKDENFQRPEAPLPTARTRVVKKNIEQSHIVLGCPAPSIVDENKYTAILMNDLLGGSMSSRLFQEIRERRGLAYSVYSYLNPLQDTGMMGMYAGVAPENSAVVTGLMRDEFNRLASETVSSAELDNAKEHARSAMLISAESPDARMMKLARNEINFGRFISYDEIVDRIESVTASEVMTLAAGCLDAGLSMACLGPMGDGLADKCGRAII